MNYLETFIQVAPDCSTSSAKIPPKRVKKSLANIQFELLSNAPYKFTQEELQFAVHLENEGLLVDAKQNLDLENKLKEEFFAQPKACMRASRLTKAYGWGVHFDRDGKMAIYSLESDKYQNFAKDKNLKQLFAMRNKRK